MKKCLLKHIVYFICSLLSLTGLSSCETTLKLPVSGERKIVLMGELVAGDTVYFHGGQSIPVKDGASQRYELLRGLEVTLQDGNGLNRRMEGREDGLPASEYMLSYSAADVIHAGRTYSLSANDPALGTATASVAIPEPFAATVLDTARVTFMGQACIRLRLSITDAPAAAHFYVVEVLNQSAITEPFFLFNGAWLRLSEHLELYDSLLNAGVTVDEKIDEVLLSSFSRVNFYTTDPASEHLLNGNIDQAARRLLLTDITFNGGSHQSDIYIPVNMVGTGFPTVVQIKSVAADYFRFLQGYEDYNPYFSGTTLVAPVRLQGNIRDGLGIVGGVFRHQYRYRF